MFVESTPLTDALTLLYQQWGQPTPELFDAMAVGYVLQQSLCPTQRLRIEVDDQGYTRETQGSANADVCLESSSDKFFKFFMQRLLAAAGQANPQRQSPTSCRERRAETPPFLPIPAAVSESASLETSRTGPQAGVSELPQNADHAPIRRLLGQKISFKYNDITHCTGFGGGFKAY